MVALLGCIMLQLSGQLHVYGRGKGVIHHTDHPGFAGNQRPGRDVGGIMQLGGCVPNLFAGILMHTVLVVQHLRNCGFGYTRQFGNIQYAWNGNPSLE
ncbi:hypothetical protein D3C76_1536770 [compost metagenome]